MSLTLSLHHLASLYAFRIILHLCCIHSCILELYQVFLGTKQLQDNLLEQATRTGPERHTRADF
ncbi:unnamed protein product [Arabidopsis halleri]